MVPYGEDIIYVCQCTCIVNVPLPHSRYLIWGGYTIFDEKQLSHVNTFSCSYSTQSGTYSTQSTICHIHILNTSYSSTSFKLVVVSAVMSQQLTLFVQVAASWKVHGKLTNNHKNNFSMLLLLINITVLPRCHHSKKNKLADAAWKAADHGKDEVVVLDVLFSSADDNG